VRFKPQKFSLLWFPVYDESREQRYQILVQWFPVYNESREQRYQILVQTTAWNITLCESRSKIHLLLCSSGNGENDLYITKT